MSDLVLAARGLSKSYSIAHGGSGHSTLAETLFSRLKHPFPKTDRETFWALKDLDFSVNRGDVIGIIGRNGAGKSTLLKILARIVEPTEGEVRISGRVGCLLEVGTGFHPELTGRENIFLNGSILGMNKREIRHQMDAIVDFSGVEQFLDTPVKRYSSGMYVRLAFAVAAHLQSEIMIVDEVLAVGDAEFQRKCLGKMHDLASGGRTVIFVSHHMQSVAVLCTKTMFLHKGQLQFIGSVEEGIKHYVDSFRTATQTESDPRLRPGTGEFRFTSVVAAREVFECGEEKAFDFRVENFRPFAGKYFLSAVLVDPAGATILQCDSRMVGYWIDAQPVVEGRFSFRTPWLKPGKYRLDLFVCSAGVIDRFEDACSFEVIPLLPYPSAGNSEATAGGMVFADFNYETATGSLAE